MFFKNKLRWICISFFPHGDANKTGDYTDKDTQSRAELAKRIDDPIKNDEKRNKIMIKIFWFA